MHDSPKGEWQVNQTFTMVTHVQDANQVKMLNHTIVCYQYSENAKDKNMFNRNK